MFVEKAFRTAILVITTAITDGNNCFFKKTNKKRVDMD